MEMKSNTMNNTDIFNELSEHVALRIHSCVSIAHKSDYVESKSHHDYDLWVVRSGQIEIQIEEKKHIASAGNLVLFYPQVPYTARAGAEGCQFIYLHFDFELGNQSRILESFPLSGIVPEHLVLKETYLFEEAFLQYKKEEGLSRIRLKAAFTILISKIIECYGRNEYMGSFLRNDSLREHVKYLSSLQPVFLHIQTHLHRSIRIPELSSLAGMSEKYFIRYFKQALGVTPGQYMYQLKMNRARDLLHSNRYTIQQIAGLLGYPDPFTFSKAFKKYYKVSPSKFE
jgi:AraC family transcriptional regulator